jgi:hypothetical protein
MMSFAKGARVAAMLAAIALAVSACETRSISNSGYPGDRWGYYGASNPLYQGELSDLDVLGIDPDRPAQAQEIAQELDAYRRPTLARGSSVMVVQSGAMIPDEPMMRELNRYFAATPVSGVPPRRPAQGSGTAEKPGAYAAALRMTAAKGGQETIFCYWGVLETAQINHVTKAVSWVPIVGAGIPDQTQRMRIRLKAAVIDVRTGRWSIFTPESFEDEALSASFTRRTSDQEQVTLLKEKGYAAAVSEFVKIYTR